MGSGERAAFAGQITDLPVGELFRTVVHGKQTGLARFETNLGSATIWFRDGSIIDADMGRFHMGAAVRRLLTADTGSFEIEFKPVSRKRLIKEDTQELIDSVDAPDSGAMAKSGPSRIRRSPVGWTPTAGGRGAAREEDGSPPKPAPPSETKQTERRPAKLEPLSNPSPAPADEDDNLTRVARIPRLVRGDGKGSTAAKAKDKVPKPPLLDLDPYRPGDTAPEAPVPKSLRRGADDPDASASDTTLGYPAHSAEPVKSGGTLSPISRRPTPRRKGTVAGIPAPVPPPRRVDTDEKTVARLAPEPPEARRRPTDPDKDKKKPRKRVTVEGRTDDGSPIEIEAEEISDPIPVGTTWDAPSHLSTPDPSRQNKRDSSETPVAGGEISSRATGSRKAKSVVPFTPGFQQTTADPGGTVTHGFRPISAEEAKAKLHTDSFPAVGSGSASSSQQRAADVAAAIGLDKTASPAPGPAPPPPAANEAAAPAVVGRYEVLLRIARGGMGTVYLCRVTGAGGFRRLFALKVIRDHLSRNQEYVTMLLQEARIASRLHHPNVVGIVDIGTLANQHYLVMDYVEGCTFSELMKVHRKSRPPQLVIPIVLDALTGLHAAHTLVNDDGSPLTLVHCDFSPQNMLVGTNGICRITDFGIARASNALPERSSVTRGKPAYLAPEQVLGRSFDHRADIFAAGVVLWNALTGEQLFAGETPEEILNKVLNGAIPLPSTMGLRPPRSLDKVVMRALMRDPAQRYQTAEEMLIDLRRVAITEDLLAPSSEVAKWVADTFGAQLELRRQAAGISSKPAAALARREPVRDVAVPELGLGAEESATHAVVHTGSDTRPDDGESRTVMLHTSGSAAKADDEALGRKQKLVIFGIAGVMALTALTIAFARPGWISGGFLDEDGTYFEPSAPVVLPTKETKTTKETKETKAPPGADDGKQPAAGSAGTVPPEPPPDTAGEATPGEPEPTPQPGPEPDPEPTPTPEPEPAPEIKTPKPEPAPKPKTPKPKPEPKPKTPKPKPESKAEPKPKPKPKPKPDKPADDAPALPKPPDFKKLFGDDKVPG